MTEVLRAVLWEGGGLLPLGMLGVLEVIPRVLPGTGFKLYRRLLLVFLCV